MKKTTVIILLLLMNWVVMAQTYQANWKSLNQRKIPAWFHQDKFGIFIHWGVYAVPAYAPVIPNSGYSYAEWYWYRLPEKQKLVFTMRYYDEVPYEEMSKILNKSVGGLKANYFHALKKIQIYVKRESSS